MLTRVLVLSLFLLAGPAAWAADGLGAVVMHGKGGTSHSKLIAPLAQALRDAGIAVEAPTMPWGKGRIYDRTYEEAMAEIDGLIAKLKAGGAAKVVVIGHSLGGNAALGYAARHPEVAGIVALASGHFPEYSGFQAKLGASVAKAKAMIEAGQGKETGSFDDLNVGPQPPAVTTAEIYFSWFAPDGPAAGTPNAQRMKPETPVLWVEGAGDNLYNNPVVVNLRETFASRPAATVVTVGADHMQTPAEARQIVVDWLRKLP